jgi:DNA-binding FadR family transcriptional regulator
MVDPSTSAGARRLGRNLTYGLTDVLGNEIVTGRYNDTRFPTEAELSSLYGVSRSVTREAVKMLTGKGLLSARPRHGIAVQPPERWNLFDSDVLRWTKGREFSLPLLRHFTELRQAIEPAAARWAAERADAKAIGQVRDALDRMIATSEGGADEATSVEADIAFHVAVLRAWGNPLVKEFEDVVSTALWTSIRFTRQFPERTSSIAAHAAVADAIAARAPVEAAAAMQALIDDVLRLIAEADERTDGDTPLV